jgi:type I restriction enzyme, S subunit
MTFPSRWSIVELGDVVDDSQYGTSIKANDNGKGIPVLRMNNITYSGSLDLRDVKHVQLPDRGHEKYCVRTGDLLFNRTNSQELVGKMAVWNREDSFAFAGYLVRMRLRRREADPSFVAAWFNTPQMKALLRSRAKPSINMSNINATEILKFPLVLPPLEDQRRIAEVLDRTEALRAKRRAALALLDTLTQSIFLDMFGDPATNPKKWATNELGKLATKMSDGPFGSNLKSSHYVSDGVRVIRLQNIGVGLFLDDDKAYVSASHFESLRKHECLPGDVLVGTLGDPNIRACVQPDWLSVALNKADCVQIRPNTAVSTARFLSTLLNLPATERMAQDLILGQTRLRISMGRLRTMKVPTPPISLQGDFSGRMAGLEKLKAAHRASLARLDELFASLQHRAFRGEL